MVVRHTDNFGHRNKWNHCGFHLLLYCECNKFLAGFAAHFFAVIFLELFGLRKLHVAKNFNGFQDHNVTEVTSKSIIKCRDNGTGVRTLSVCLMVVLHSNSNCNAKKQLKRVA